MRKLIALTLIFVAIEAAACSGEKETDASDRMINETTVNPIEVETIEVEEILYEDILYEDAY